ncbi:MAG: BMP family ABC transporter substrate-binding protein [Spirochaetales bacterium]|jgi:basic membrane protein A|nr:BMP family ABC transporter substrate-binding protein [Spirochaetales bacterium]
MKKSVLLFTIAAVLLPVLAGGCNKTAAAPERKISFGMATDVGGLGDKSFNDGAWQGLVEAGEQYGAEAIVVESKQQTDYVPNLTGLAEDGNQLVVAVGFLMEEAVKETARHNPDTFFAGVDIGSNPGDPPNFQGIVYNEHEASYLAGVFAGLMTRQYASRVPGKLNNANVIGVVLGMLVPAVERYEVGYIAGAKSVNPDITVLSVVTDTFSDLNKAKESAAAMISQGADIIFAAAGAAGLGAINAADEGGVLAIGCDLDQNDVAPGTIITSALKNVPRSTFLVAESVVNNTFQGGTAVYSIQEDAVGLAGFHQFDSQVPQEVKDKIAQTILDMKAGNIHIPTTRAELESLGIRR